MTFTPIVGVLTAYGYPADSTPDTNSANAIGAWDNHLIDGVSLAVSRDVEHAFRNEGIKPLDKVEIQFHDKTTRQVVWADRTAVSYNGKPLVGRFDLYCKFKPDKLTGATITGFCRV